MTLACLVAAATASPLAGQDRTPPDPEVRRVSITFTAAPIERVLLAFATFSGKSIIPGPEVEGQVTASIDDQPWDVALAAILAGHGLRAIENEAGIIHVRRLDAVAVEETAAALLTRTYRANYTPAAELEVVIRAVLSDRGTVSVVPSTNTVVVTDVERVHRAIAGIVR